MVKSVVTSKLLASGTMTTSSTPSKLNACPTSPVAKVAPFCGVPLLPSQASLALPSPGQQLTRPLAGPKQVEATAFIASVRLAPVSVNEWPSASGLLAVGGPLSAAVVTNSWLALGSFQAPRPKVPTARTL